MLIVKRTIGFLSVIIALAGCTTAGPYVTNISSDGRNGLDVEKCKVHFNAWMGTVSTGDCISQRIQLTAYPTSSSGYSPAAQASSQEVQLQQLMNTPGLSYEEYTRRYRAIRGQ